MVRIVGSDGLERSGGISYTRITISLTAEVYHMVRQLEKQWRSVMGEAASTSSVIRACIRQAFIREMGDKALGEMSATPGMTKAEEAQLENTLAALQEGANAQLTGGTPPVKRKKIRTRKRTDPAKGKPK